MPIRLNLLAEAQAAEELRRRDPVKRAMWVGAFLVALMLGWSAYIWGQSLIAEKQLHRVEAGMADYNTEFQAVVDNQKKFNEVRSKLDKLRQLSAHRVLNVNLLNALQQTVLDDVQLTRLKIDQT